MIDLSYLTEEEQEMIMAVLKRDADLKKVEDQRVKDLQKTPCDKNKLKYMTGEWFYETKSQRHRDRIHGSDIIRASIRQRKPVTVFELSKMWSEKPSFVNSGNHDVFIPPELSGLIDEPQALPKNQSRDYTGSQESQPDVLKLSVQSQIKQRLNPFNNKPTSLTSPDGQSQQVSNGTTQTVKLRAGEFLPSYESPIVPHTNQTSESSQELQATPLYTNKPEPRKRILHVSQDSSVNRKWPSCKQVVTMVPRGILKHNSLSSSSSSSSNDSLPPQSPWKAEPKSPIDHPDLHSSGSVKGGWLDRKHVRFSGIVRGRNPALQDGRELGEHGLLDLDSFALSDEEDSHTDKSDTSISSSNGDDVSSGSLSSPREECDNPFFSQTMENIELELYISSSSTPPWASKVVNHEEVKTGELQNSTEGSLQKDSKEGEALWSTGVYSGVTEPPASQVSDLHVTVPDKGKTKAQRPGSPTPKLSEEEGHSIAKVLDWFSQSSGSSSWSESRHNMEEEGSTDHECVTGRESKSSEESNLLESKRMPKPSPKPRRGILALFSRAEVKEGTFEAVTSVEDEASCPDESKGDACQDVPLVLSEEQAPLTLEEMSKHEGLGISVVHSTNQRTVRENCDRTESFGSASKFVKERAGRERNILTRKEGDIGTEFENFRTGLTSQIQKSTKVHKQDDESRHSHFDHKTANMNNSQSVENHNKEQHISFESGKPDISFKPTDERGTSTNYSISSMKGEKLGGSSQGADSVDAHQGDNVPMYLPSLNTKKEEDTSGYIPPLNLSQSLQQGKAILIKNLRALWEEEKMKYNLNVTKEKETDRQAEQGEAPSLADSTERLLTPQHGLQTTAVSDSHQERKELIASSVNRENSSHNILFVKDRETVSEQSEGMEESLKQTSILKHTKKPPPLTETKSLRATNPNQIANLNTTPGRQRKNESKASPGENVKSTVNSQQKGQAVAHSPKGLSKIPRRSSSKTRLDRSPLKTYAIDIGAERTDGSTSEDQSTNHTRPSPELIQPQQSKRTDNQKIVQYQTKRGSSDERPPATCTDAQAQPLENSTPKCVTKSARRQASRTSSGSIQGAQYSPHQEFPEEVGVVKQSGTPSPHSKRIARSHWIGRTFRVTKDSEAHSQPARSTASLDRHHYLGLSEQMPIPVILDTPDKNSRYLTEDISRQLVMDAASRQSSPSHLSHQSSVELGSSWSSTPEPWSYSWASSAYDSPDTSPVRIMLKRASRPMSLSKSLEDITTMPTREERMRTDQRSDLMLSADDVSAVPSSPSSPPDPEQMKRMSASVPAFLQQESDDKDSDCTSESSFYSFQRTKKRSSRTNHSFSSGMASMSSSVSGSVMSVCSGDIGNVDVKGTIQFAMNYVEKLGEFHIFVVRCQDLAVGEPKRNRSDPYVKCYLLPDKTKLGKRKTSVKKKTLNPTFNEILRYKISLDTLRSTSLNLSVWHNDNFGRNSFLGEVDVDLRMWNISDTQMKDYLLRPRVVTRPKTTDQRGEMRVALRFLPQVTQSKRSSKAGEVQIWVRECKSLPVVRGVIIDPFVKCTVLPDTSRKSRQKTRVAKKTADPVFNHTMVFDGFKPEDLQEACVELTVWDHDRLNNHFLGGLRLGLGTGKSYGSEVDWMDSTADEATLWNRMMISPGEWVEDVLPLRMLMMARSMAR